MCLVPSLFLFSKLVAAFEGILLLSFFFFSWTSTYYCPFCVWSSEKRSPGLHGLNRVWWWKTISWRICCVPFLCWEHDFKKDVFTGKQSTFLTSFLAYLSLSAFSRFQGFCLFVLIQNHHWTVHSILQLFLDGLHSLASFLPRGIFGYVAYLESPSIPSGSHNSLLWNHRHLGRRWSSHVPALVSASFWHLAVPTSRKMVQVTFLCLPLHLNPALLCTELGGSRVNFSRTLSKEIPCVCQV